MEKKLLLVRHAKSDWSVAGQKDFDRELNMRGLMSAPKVGGWLLSQGFIPDKVYASAARRAFHTAELVAEQLQIPLAEIEKVDEIYEASPRTLLDFVNRIPNHFNTVMVFGHNPGFTYLAEYLTGEVLGNIPTAGSVLVTFSLSDWALVSKDTGKISWTHFPEKE